MRPNPSADVPADRRVPSQALSAAVGIWHDGSLVKAGLAAARAKGTGLGRPRKVDPWSSPDSSRKAAQRPRRLEGCELQARDSSKERDGAKISGPEGDGTVECSQFSLLTREA